MSQLRDLGGKLRAAIAIAAVWALIFSLSASSAIASNPPDVAYKSGPQASAGLFACFKRHMTQRADIARDKAPQSDHAGKHRCPCCLAAGAAAAVLPARVATDTARIPLEKPVFYAAIRCDAQESDSSRSAHGARAPPR